MFWFMEQLCEGKNGGGSKVTTSRQCWPGVVSMSPPLCQECAAAVTQRSEEQRESAQSSFVCQCPWRVHKDTVLCVTKKETSLTSTSTLFVLQWTANVSGGLLEHGANNAVLVTHDIHNINLGLGSICEECHQVFKLLVEDMLVKTETWDK